MIFPRVSVTVTAFALLLLVGCTRNHLKVGRTFESREDFDKAAERSGFTVVGRLNESFPAEIASVSEANVKLDISVPESEDTDLSGVEDFKARAVIMKRVDGEVMSMFLVSKEK